VLRVMIFGPGGAGKSWLAKQLAAVTGLPVVHLDREYWRPNWVETPKAEWKAKVKSLADRDRWIIDGNYGGTLALRMERADTIICLDVSRWTSLVGALCRRMRGEARDDIADGCPEKLDFEFLRWLWRYHDHHRPSVLEELGNFAHGRTIVTLHDRHEIEQWLLRLRDVTTR
jgi:adenylate kinase family enzyme